MAVIPGVVVDFTLSPRIITIPVGGAPVTVSIADLQDTLQDIEDNEEDGILYPRLRDCSGGEQLGPGRFVGYTMKLNNAQVVFQGQTTPTSEGAATADDPSGRVLTDLGATFVSDGVERGSVVFDWTSRAAGVVTQVISETQIRHVALSGGTRTTWLTGDEYRVYPSVRCELSGGNLVAVDENGDPLEPLMASPGVYPRVESATSASLLAGSGGATPEEIREAVLDGQVAGRPPGSLGASTVSIGQDVQDVSGKADTIEGKVDGVDTKVSGVDATLLDVQSDVVDVHDEALGKRVLNPKTSTETLYRLNGSVLQVFNLKVAVGDVPPYVEKEPVP